jgi:hypothetical protein
MIETFEQPDGGAVYTDNTDGDADFESIASDFDGDGDVELVQYDANGDGTLESLDFPGLYGA